MVEAEAAAQQPVDPPRRRGGIMGSLMNMMLMYWLATTGIEYFTGGGQKGGSAPAERDGAVVAAALPTTYEPGVSLGTMFNMQISFRAERMVPDPPAPTQDAPAESAKSLPVNTNATEDGGGGGNDDDDDDDGETLHMEPLAGWSAPVLRMPSLRFHPDEQMVERTVALNVTMCAASNCTIIADVDYVSSTDRAIHVNYSIPLVVFLTEKVQQARNLFDDEPAAPVTEVNSTVTKAYMQVAITVCPVADTSVYSDPVPDPIKNFLRLVPSTLKHEAVGEDGQPTRQRGKYFPIVYNNDFWILKSTLIELNASTPDLVNITISHYPISLIKFMVYTQMDQAFSMHESSGLMGKKERDETKRIFLETNPYFLGLTMAVSLLHLVFEYLAFSNDVSFWRNKKDFKGLSLRTVALNCYFQAIIFLYLLDGDTSWTVYVPSGVGVLIEFWKLRKVIIVRKNPESGKWEVEFKSSYDSTTRRYDMLAMKYLTYLLLPCLVGYSVYSALNHSYKGWYSFFIATQVRFIYFSGFIMMTPQIFINYKLKSVAHLPWRTFVYKALNTFIDDMFAFIITMPTMHRLACFRDDIIFFILLYQRWIYPVDRKRTEHGDDDDGDGDEGASGSGVEGENKGERGDAEVAEVAAIEGSAKDDAPNVAKKDKDV